MMHAPAHLLIEFADGELQGSARDQLRRHLSDCSSCEAALFELKATRGSFLSLLTELDHAEPEVWAPRVQALYEHAPGRRARFGFDSVWRWAAGIVLLSGAAAAGAAILRDRATTVPPVPTQTTPRAAAPERAPAGGVFVFPQDNAALVELSGALRGTRIVVRVTDDRMIGMHSYGEFTPTFTAQTGRIVVRMPQAPAELRMLVPASLTELRIVANGVTVGVIESGSLRAPNGEAGIKIELEGR